MQIDLMEEVLMKLSDTFKRLEDEGLIAHVEMCRNDFDGSPEMHIWFSEGDKSYDIIKSEIPKIEESKYCPIWE